MRKLQIRSLATVAFLVFAGTSAAQDKSPALLSTLEVRQLVAHAQPNDHARLSAHFTALADRYTAEAKRHTSMSQDIVGNPSRNLTSGLSAHCKHLAQLNAESAAAVNELAAHHQKLAAGASATAPTAGTRFDEGAGAPAPTDLELDGLAAKASTPTDHRNLEEYFLALAKRYAADGKEHASMAQAYRSTRLAGAGAHCDRLVALSRDAAKEATATAAMHKQLAGGAR